MGLCHAETHLGTGWTRESLAYCKEFLVGLLVQPWRVLYDAVVFRRKTLDEPLVEDPEVHRRATERGEAEIPGAGDDRGNSGGEGGSVGFVGLVNCSGVGGAEGTENAGRHGVGRIARYRRLLQFSNYSLRGKENARVPPVCKCNCDQLGSIKRRTELLTRSNSFKFIQSYKLNHDKAARSGNNRLVSLDHACLAHQSACINDNTLILAAQMLFG